MDTVDAALFYAVRALFLSETGRIAGKRKRQFVSVDDLPHESADHGVFRSADQVQIFPFDFVHHVIHFVETHHARNHVAVNHIRRNHVRETFIYHKIARVGKHRRMKPRNIARQIIKSLPRSAPCGIHVDSVQLF